MALMIAMASPATPIATDTDIGVSPLRGSPLAYVVGTVGRRWQRPSSPDARSSGQTLHERPDVVEDGEGPAFVVRFSPMSDVPPPRLVDIAELSTRVGQTG